MELKISKKEQKGDKSKDPHTRNLIHSHGEVNKILLKRSKAKCVCVILEIEAKHNIETVPPDSHHDNLSQCGPPHPTLLPNRFLQESGSIDTKNKLNCFIF